MTVDESSCSTRRQGHAIDAAALNDAGVALARENRGDLAIAKFQAAIAASPDFAEPHINLGIALERRGEFAEAEKCYGRALAIEPLNPAAHFNMAVVLEKRGDVRHALRWYRSLLELRPDFPEGAVRLGCTLLFLQEWQEAESIFREVVRENPNHLPSRFRWIVALQHIKQFCEAEEVCRRSLWMEDAASRKGPSDVRMRSRLKNELGNILLALRRAAEAVECFRQATEADPSDAMVHNNWAYTIHFLPETTPEQIRDVAVLWGQRHASGPVVSHPPRIQAERLRIGYVTEDLRGHPSWFFLEPVLRQHDRSRFEIFLYADVPGSETAERITRAAEHWRPVRGMTDAEMEKRVRADEVDLLIDVVGHSGNCRLGLFAKKPAPVQVSWLGYASTTGIPQIDWRITDEIVDPPGAEAFYSERLIRLPHTYQCYGPSDSPEVGPLPSAGNGYITFGCLNNPCKGTPEVIAAWASILRGIPDAKLMLLVNGEAREKAATLHRFAAAGIEAKRLILLPPTKSRLEYLEWYRQIDLGLDPFPFNGCTTTCDSLWMGAPVVTLAGRTSVSRLGAMLLGNVGLANWVTTTPADYAAVAISRALDRIELAEVRRTLRARMAASPLCDAAQLTAELEAVFTRMMEQQDNLDAAFGMQPIKQ